MPKTTKKCLLLFWHGIGDLINLTPTLRELHKHGYYTDVLVQRAVSDSGVFEACPYARLIPMDIGSVTVGGKKGQKAQEQALAEFEKRKDAYDGHWSFTSGCWQARGALMALYYEEVAEAMSLTRAIKQSPTVVYGPPEIWIPEECEQEAAAFVEKNYPNRFVFKHTMMIRTNKTAAHVIGRHGWPGADSWIKREFPEVPVFDTADYGEWSNINVLFSIAKKARYRVLSSSFMVHACEAMGAPMDIVNYTAEATKHWPEDPNIIKIIRRKENLTAKYSFNGGRTWVTE